jgi:hypothetical protein
METLVCVLGSGKGSWGHITRLIMMVVGKIFT